MKASALNTFQRRRVVNVDEGFADFLLERRVDALAESPHIFRYRLGLFQHTNHLRVDLALVQQAGIHRLGQAAGRDAMVRHGQGDSIVRPQHPQRVVPSGDQARPQQLIPRYPVPDVDAGSPNATSPPFRSAKVSTRLSAGTMTTAVNVGPTTAWEGRANGSSLALRDRRM